MFFCYAMLNSISLLRKLNQIFFAVQNCINSLFCKVVQTISMLSKVKVTLSLDMYFCYVMLYSISLLRKVNQTVMLYSISLLRKFN